MGSCNSGDGIVDPSFFVASEWSGLCPHCLRWHALTLVAVESDRVAESVRRFRCKHCGKETTYPDGLPQHVLG